MNHALLNRFYSVFKDKICTKRRTFQTVGAMTKNGLRQSTSCLKMIFKILQKFIVYGKIHVFCKMPKSFVQILTKVCS